MNDPRAKLAVVVANLGKSPSLITLTIFHNPNPGPRVATCITQHDGYGDHGPSVVNMVPKHEPRWPTKILLSEFGLVTHLELQLVSTTPGWELLPLPSSKVAPLDSLLFYKSTNLNKPHTQQHDCQPQWLFAFCGACCRAWCITWAQFSSPVSCTICNSTAPRSSRCSWRSESFFDVKKAPHKKKRRQILPLNNAFFENHGLMLLDHTEKKQFFVEVNRRREAPRSSSVPNFMITCITKVP